VVIAGTTNAATAANATFGTVPSGYRPAVDVYGIKGACGGDPAMDVTAAGVIKFNGAIGSGTSMWFTVTYVAA